MESTKLKTREYEPIPAKATAMTTASSFAPVRCGLLLQRKCACGSGTLGLDDDCAECRGKQLALRGRETDQGASSVAPPVVDEVLRSPGRPLELATRAYMKPRLGHDFGRVQVHTDARAPVNFQTKLVVNAPGDAYEQEADRVADQVMRIPPLQRACTSSGKHPKPPNQAEQLQTNSIPESAPESTMAPPIVHEVLRLPGQPLAAATRAFFEPRFGHDFSQVHVHTDTRAAEAARAINALAYTSGQEIVFGAGQYTPCSESTQRLLAHELTHVVQQGAAPAVAHEAALVRQVPLPGSTGRIVQREPQQSVLSPSGDQGAPDFSKMNWIELLPRAHGDKKDKNKRFIQIAKVQNAQDQTPTLIYDDKHIAVDPAPSAPPPAPRVPNTVVGAPFDTDTEQTRKDYEAAVNRAVQKIIAARASIPPRDFDRDPYGTKGGNFYDPVVAGWEPQPKDDPRKHSQVWMTERNKQKKIDDPQGGAYKGWLSSAMPTGLDPSNADDMKKWEIFKKTIPLEGRIGTITTFDRTLTVGVGFSSSGGQAQKVIGKAFNMLPAVKDVAFSAGLTVDGKGGMQVVDTDSKWILDGQDAAAYVQTNQALLSLLVNVSQGAQPDVSGNTLDAAAQAKQRQAWLDTQWRTFLAEALGGIPAEILAWPIESVVLATHTRHALSGTFPWSFWTSHNNHDLRAMVEAIYEKLRDTNQLHWLYPICGGIYKPIAEAVEKKKSAASAAADNAGGKN